MMIRVNLWAPILGKRGYPHCSKLAGEICIDRIADRLIEAGVIQPFIIVLPNLNRDVALNVACKHYFIEVVDFVDRTYKTIPDRTARIICGHSSGGSDAMFIALDYP